jgi:hypothetical protein
MTTTSTIALAELAEKGADVDMLRQMVQFMAQRLMDIDVEFKGVKRLAALGWRQGGDRASDRQGHSQAVDPFGFDIRGMRWTSVPSSATEL